MTTRALLVAATSLALTAGGATIAAQAAGSADQSPTAHRHAVAQPWTAIGGSTYAKPKFPASHWAKQGVASSPTPHHKPRPHQPRFHVAAGWTFTNPIGRYEASHAIKQKVVRTINAVPPGATIRLVSWNFDNFGYVKALKAAHDRGVSVRIIMARTLSGDSAAYHAMRRDLAGHGNARRSPAMRSWFHTCSHSCRGRGGAMHAKYFIFSQAGASKDIVMNTSANLTSASATIQWNEMYTVVGDEKAYDNYMDVFAQATKDKKAPYHQFVSGPITGWWYPRLGRSDLVTDLLDQVHCGGAEGTTGIKGHSIVRVAQDVFNNTRGVRIARKLLQLKKQGCNVEVVYSQAVGATRPLIHDLGANHLVQDTNGDGIYDKYLHAKLLAISGHIGKSHHDRIVMDGSANYSATALQSDEQGMIIHLFDVERAYARFIDRMYHTHLVNRGGADGGTDGRRMVVNPYSQMEG